MNCEVDLIKGSIYQYSSIGLDDGLVSTRLQAIIFADDG